MKKIEESSSKKGIEAIQTPAAVHAVETDTWCEVCGGDDHSGNNCPETQEKELHQQQLQQREPAPTTIMEFMPILPRPRYGLQ